MSGKQQEISTVLTEVLASYVPFDYVYTLLFQTYIGSWFAAALPPAAAAAVVAAAAVGAAAVVVFRLHVHLWRERFRAT